MIDGESWISGLIGLVIGLCATYVASLIWPTPWTLAQALIAVGIASFCAAFFGRAGADPALGLRFLRRTEPVSAVGIFEPAIPPAPHGFEGGRFVWQ